MKKQVTIVDYQDSWHRRQLLSAAKKYGYFASVVTFDGNFEKELQKLSGSVIWRKSFLDKKSERAALQGYLKNKLIVNDSIFRFPYIAHKYFQQNFLASKKDTRAWSIPTYRATNRAQLSNLISDHILAYPFVAKPNLGAEGRGVEVIKNSSDLKKLAQVSEYVFQNFITNDGDWRVLMVGGAPLGAIKRVAAAGSDINNYSQGGSVSRETDPAILEQIYKMAGRAASLFHLTFCGVDIIRDQRTGKLYILEVNTVPAFEGFLEATGINAADALFEWLAEKQDKTSPIDERIERYLTKRIVAYDREAFHLASRLWLWKKSKWAKQFIEGYETKFIGSSDKETREIIAGIVNRSSPKDWVNSSEYSRSSIFKRYPKLAIYNSLLYKTLWAETLYGKDIRPIVEEFVDKQEFLDLYKKLITDKDAVCLLSTHAVNYFYWVKNYFRFDDKLSEQLNVGPEALLKISKDYEKLVRKEVLTRAEALKLEIYLLTHAIIGESRFYANPNIKDQSYHKLCEVIEQIIAKNYFQVSLDNKFEFLVCAAMCSYKSHLHDLIMQEAAGNMSWAGNFIVKPKYTDSTKHCLRSAEHRNSLYLMVRSAGKLERRNRRSLNLPNTKKTVGSFEKISFPDLGLKDVIAKIDTGAASGSIHATHIKEVILPTGKKALSFRPYGNKPEVILRQYNITEVRSSNGQVAKRYLISTKVEIKGVLYSIKISLADRSLMMKGTLIGRKFLRSNGFIVDVKKGTKYRFEVK